MKIKTGSLFFGAMALMFSSSIFSGTSDSRLNRTFEFTHGNTKYKNLGVPVYWQEDKCWCGITAIEMWSDYINKNNNFSYFNKQLSLAHKYDAGVFVKSNKYARGWTCLGFEGETNGLKVNDIRLAMQKQTGKRFRNFKRTSDNDIFKRIKEQINKNQPVVFSGNTIYKNRNKPSRIGGHYFVINGIMERTYGDKKLVGIWINDPANGKITSYVKPVSFSTKYKFSNKYLAKYKERGRYYKYLVHQY